MDPSTSDLVVRRCDGVSSSIQAPSTDSKFVRDDGGTSSSNSDNADDVVINRGSDVHGDDGVE